MNSLQIELLYSHHSRPSEPENFLSIDLQEKYKNKLILDVELDIILSKPKVLFSDIVGQEHAKRILQEHIILPFRYPQLFVGIRRPSSGIWLYGPSGTGKRLLVQACANEIDGPVFLLETQDLLLKGPKRASEKMKKTFAAAKAVGPSIIYIDDIVSLVPGVPTRQFSRAWRSFRTEFFIECNALRDSSITIMTTSQKPWLLDSYARRKLEKRIYIPLPDEPSRKELIDKQVNSSGFSPLALEDQEYLIKETKGFSAAEIKEFIRKACYEPMREAQRSKTFKVHGELSDGFPRYQACDEADPEAKEMSLLDIPPEQLKLRDILRGDFERVWRQIEPDNDELEVWKNEEWTRDFGEEWRNFAYN